jgi:hypothetical protein
VSKIDLRDTTFCLPVFLDNSDRAENLKITYDYLNDTFDTRILVGEMDKESRIKDVPVDVFIHMDDWYFHKTRVLNILYKLTRTPIIVRYDIDCQFHPSQLVAARDQIKNGADMSYPFCGTFHNFDRKYKQFFIDKKAYELPLGNKLNVKEDHCGTLISTVSYGGVSFHNKLSFFASGIENQHLKSWGAEDTCVFHRLRQLGKVITRTEGTCYHLDHDRTMNSSSYHEFAGSNETICNQMGYKSKSEIEREIDTWDWVK